MVYKITHTVNGVSISNDDLQTVHLNPQQQSFFAHIVDQLPRARTETSRTVSSGERR